MKVLTEIAPIALPTGWRLRRVRDVATLINGFPFKSEDFDSSGDVPLVRIRDLTASDFALYVPKSVVPPQALLRNGDLAIGMDGDFNTVLWSRGPAALNQRVCILRPRDGTDIRFLSYVLPSVLQIINDLTYSTTVKHLSGSDVLQQLVPFPDFKQQQRISQFLDRETTQIDDLIRKQERLIQLLAEKRQAVIADAVTKGIDPTVPTKPSGIPWLGDVPKHWALPKLKNCCQVKRGRFMHRPRNAPHLYDGEYPFIQTGSIARAQGKYVTEYSQTLSEAGLETSVIMPKGTLVMAIAANIGDVAILSFDSCAPDSVLGFQPTSQTTTDFLYYALTAKREELTSEAPVTSQGNLNVERVGSVTVPLPPVQEQLEIVKKLDDKLVQMSYTAMKASAMKRLLLERRSALISAAATGEIEVQEEVA
ncbi:restriction endonuclease subunit S [Arthrobacter sp. MDT3-44]